jgi:cobalt/nickel transport system permease protein
MMLGHLTVAGLAELFITAGLVAFLQRHDAALLKDTNAGAIAATDWRRARRLWAGAAALMIASPLGLLAAGTAWGEWRAAAFADPAARVTIAASSGHVAPPDAVPAGLARLAGFWTAPIPDYAPAFLHGQAAGYIVSALFGGGLIIAAVLALSAMARWLRPASPA